MRRGSKKEAKKKRRTRGEHRERERGRKGKTDTEINTENKYLFQCRRIRLVLYSVVELGVFFIAGFVYAVGMETERGC